jgi:hypothetical protein
VADGVLVTGRTTASASSTHPSAAYFGLESDTRLLGQLAGRLYGGLFGSSSAKWMQTIRKWSEDPSTYQMR